MREQLLTEEERKIDYSQLLFKTPAEPDPKGMQEIIAGPAEPDQIISIQNRNDILLPERPEVKNGYTRKPDGSGAVVTTVEMPGVTPEMIIWWFAWHGLDTFRYVIWDKDDHYYCQSQSVEKNLDSSLSMKERYWNTTHMVEEVIVPGAEARRFPIHFVPPWEVGFDRAKWEKFTGTIISTNGTMIHFLRQKPEGGYELRTRFYMGWSFDGEKYTYDQNRPVIWELAEGLLLHNVKEYRHLAEILPEVYAEFKDNFRVGLD